MLNKFVAVAIAAAAAAPISLAAAEDVEIEKVRKELKDLKDDYESRIRSLEERLRAAESSSQTAPTASPPVPVSPAVTPSSGVVVPQSPAIPGLGSYTAGAVTANLSLSALFAGGGSSVNDAELANLQAGGHDPSRNGFTVQNVEVVLSGAVDPYFDGQANLIFLIDSAGETVVELEEAFATTRSLPYGLQVKAGQFFLEFGRQNQQHPHSWDFVDQPVIMSRLFGPDNLRSQGARISWLTPLPWYSELEVGANNAGGETLASFLFVPGETVAGYTIIDRGGARAANDLLYNARWLNGGDVTDTVSVNVGLSGLRGPNGTGFQTFTEIYGADLYLRWKPLRTERGFPFVAWQTEYMRRSYEAGDSDLPGSARLRDRGYYTQFLYGFRPRWVAGLRWEEVSSDDSTGSDPLRDNRKRLSVNTTWYPTEYSKLRLQYNRDDAQHLTDEIAHGVWLQFEFNLGTHAAHKF